MAKDQEHKLQVSLMQWLAAVHKIEYALTFAVPNGGHRHPAVAAKLKAEGVKRGVPDVFMAVPRGDKLGLFIELKTEKGRPTEEQKTWIKLLNNQGYKAVICKGYDAAKTAIEEYLRGE